MTSAHKRDTAVDATNGGVASGAALFVTFYISRDKASSLHEQLLPFTPTAPDDHGQPLDNRLLMGRVDPPAAHDATAIRLIFNAPGDAATAWESMRQQLGAILDALDSPDDWWGYTVIYQAVLNGGGSADAAFADLLPAVRRVDSSESLQSLVKADLSGGAVWLVDVPQQGNGIAAATICVALGPPNVENTFKEVLLGPRLLLVDLIAHKGYYLRRQYRGKLQQKYREQLGAFWEGTNELLGHLSKQERSSDKLNRLAHVYRMLVGIVSKLKRLSLSMTQQLHNYEPWRRLMEGNGIVEYHYGHLEMGNRDLELMVVQGEDALEVANTAMSMTQVELDKELERRQRQIADLLAVVGAALAVPELVNQPAAKAFIRSLEFQADHNFSPLAFLIQLAAIIVTAVLIASAVRLVDWWRVQRRAGE